MKRPALLPSALLLTLAISVAAVSACGGVVVEPIGAGETAPPAASADPNKLGSGVPVAKPIAPIGPYTGLVGTTDVSILYPLPLKGASTDFVRPSEAGVHGPLLRQASFEAVMPGQLERVSAVPASGYATLALISLRLDPCSARAGAGCTSEVRAVFQAVYDRTAVGPDNDATQGAAATDGALHVIYDVVDAELVIMMKQILTLKAANGGLASQILEPHPILAKQGLGGPFATGLRAIILEHLGDDRIGRITGFDHNTDPDEDGWGFRTFDKSGTTLTAGKIPHLDSTGLLISGSSALLGPLTQTNASGIAAAPSSDSVGALVAPARHAGAPQSSALQAAFDAALRIQNPKLHNATTTDCGNCHLAEGARLVGESAYSLQATNAFTSARPLGYKTERSSVTNLHAFGYLHRKVSIMQRTANESVLVADAMEQRVK